MLSPQEDRTGGMTHLDQYSNPLEFDMALQEPVFGMMRRGIRVDLEQKERFAVEFHEKWDDLQTKLNKVVGKPLNVNSHKQMKEWLYGEMRLPVRRKKKKVTADEDAIRALMALCENKLRTLKQADAKQRWLRAYLSLRLTIGIREVRKKISSYTGCPEGCGCKSPSTVIVDPDERMRSLIAVGGTWTARFSHSKTLWGTGCNLATVPRPLRTMFLPDEGMELAEFDLNRGESWVYSFLSLDPEMMRIHLDGDDFHSETASAISTAFEDEPLTVEWVIENKNGDGYKIRYLGKKVNHASAYRMGPFRGAEVVNEEADDTGITVTVSQMKKAQNLWKQKYLGMRGWWDGIDRQLAETRRLTTPYGRSFTFFDPLESVKKDATACVPQSTSVDYLNLGMLRVFHELDKKGLLQLLHQNHDSILIQYNPQRRAEVMGEVTEKLTSTLIINDHKISIPIEGSYGQNWLELEEWQGV